jgi:hypothetical protein
MDWLDSRIAQLCRMVEGQNGEMKKCRKGVKVE